MEGYECIPGGGTAPGVPGGGPPTRKGKGGWCTAGARFAAVAAAAAATGGGAPEDEARPLMEMLRGLEDLVSGLVLRR